MTMEARVELFSSVGCSGLRKYAKDPGANLSTWEGEQETGRGKSQMKLIFALFGTQRKEEGDAGAVTLAGTAPPVCSSLVLRAPSGDTASVLPLFSRASDVHLKLSVIP